MSELCQKTISSPSSLFLLPENFNLSYNQIKSQPSHKTSEDHFNFQIHQRNICMYLSKVNTQYFVHYFSKKKEKKSLREDFKKKRVKRVTSGKKVGR